MTLSVTSHFYLGTYVLTRCHVVTDINYVDRGAAAAITFTRDTSFDIFLYLLSFLPHALPHYIPF